MGRRSLVLVAAVLSACASTPAGPELDAQAKLFRAPTDKGCIYIVPSPSTASVAITVDGRKVATLDMRNFLRLEVSSGRHVLTVARTSPLPFVFREPRDDLALEAEAGRCYFLRTVWRQDANSLQQFRVFWERLTEQEGQREVNVRSLAVPTE